MIKIDSRADYQELNRMHPLAKKHIISYCDFLMTEYEIEDLHKIGSVIFLETKKDVNDLKKIGLDINNNLNEFAEILEITNGIDVVRLIHAVFVVSNSTAYSVLIPEKFAPDHTKTHLFQEFTGTKILDYRKEDTIENYMCNRED